MTNEGKQLIDELRQICVQYAKEVPGARRPWPASIKSRVMRLRFLGVSNHRIAQETGIPVMTLYCWKMPEGERARALPTPEKDETGFEAVQVVQRATGLVTNGRQGEASGRRRRGGSTLTVKKGPAPTTVTVVTPGGVRLEGLGFDEAVEAARRLSK